MKITVKQAKEQFNLLVPTGYELKRKGLQVALSALADEDIIIIMSIIECNDTNELIAEYALL